MAVQRQPKDAPGSKGGQFTRGQQPVDLPLSEALTLAAETDASMGGSVPGTDNEDVELGGITIRSAAQLAERLRSVKPYVHVAGVDATVPISKAQAMRLYRDHAVGTVRLLGGTLVFYDNNWD